ncbi:NAD(P)-dependent glycerol-3-phosphate dehydrogenase [Roseococcus sp. SYP-B2431]|uniref:NAD(P)H-dependent glycerol-3-phosphate dehydrogenase n=1 Tax=Roseococcus sp. SYP-B2431 TaxID=2496640 RepID=UPI00103B8833|nr:NAD(P)H-dependent glycerol-3-phosphate dehydrogenase [Roseococcus sp. SYP-B2431]TCH98712.1 NAD(P)-dependent glycerol-3-phosphate dehydrogenase [Roseococcus sp. SYP-B2431]
MSEIAVIGAGAWGTALAIHATRLGHRVVLWARDPLRAEAMEATRENARLSGVRLPEALRVTGDAREVLGAKLGILAVPMQPLRATLATLPAGLPPLLLACKGLETGSLRLPLEVLAEARPDLAAGVLSGPNFAHEVAAGLPAASVVAAAEMGLCEQAQSLLSGGGLRLYASEDALGVQLGGAAKNVLAIASGIATGAGLGENARAALVTRGLAELSRLVVGMGGRAETASGLSGLGDLLLTATGPSSRNTSLGMALGQGKGLAEILAGRAAVTEGVTTAPALLARAAEAGVELPVCAAVVEVLEGRLDVQGAIRALLERPVRQE